MKIVEIVATRWLKCTKFDFGWGSAPDPLGSLQRSPRPLAAFNGPTSTARDGGKGMGGSPGSSDSPPPGCRGARIISGLQAKCLRLII